MIPANTKHLLDEVVDIVLAPRKEVLRVDLQRAAERASMAGVAGSPFAAFAIAKVYYDLVEKLANQVWSEIRRVLNEIRFRPYAGIEEDLKRYFKGKLATPYEECRSGVYSDPLVLQNQPKPTFKDHYERLERKILADIDLFCAKLLADEAERQASKANQAITYNLHGDNSRVLINSLDRSINLTDSKSIFEALRTQIQDNFAEELKQQLLVKAREMETAVGNRDSFLKRYSEFVELAANHMTVLGQFIPALTQFLST